MNSIQMDVVNLQPRSAARTVALVRGWGNCELTTRCLTSLRKYYPPNQLRIIYVDNGSLLKDYLGLLKQFPDVEFVRFQENYGSCRGINAGMLMAALEPHEFVLLMDNDTEVPAKDDEWLERWIGYFDDEKIGAAGATSNYVSGLQNIEVCPETYMKEWQHDDKKGMKGPLAVTGLISFALMFRRTALEAIGWFADEQFEPGNSEDLDLCFRMVEKGWVCVVAQSVYIHHKGSQTFSKLNFKQILNTNIQKLVQKYGVERLKRLGVSVNNG
jgi:GT2 family glycosyltransferase